MGDTIDEEFEPNSEFLEVLTSMGISKAVATEALFCTGNQSLDVALNFIFNSEETQYQQPESGEMRRASDRIEEQVVVNEQFDEEGYYKMIFVVNSSLKMSVGKLSAQVAHACLGLYRKMLGNNLKDVLDNWELTGEKKVVLKGIDHVHLQELHERALSASIPSYLIVDAGKTQIPPDSVTVLSIFGSEDEIDKITGKLGLL